MRNLSKYLSKDAIIVMDDIQNNSFFFDFIKMTNQIIGKYFNLKINS